jgi:hypothetical protein
MDDTTRYWDDMAIRRNQDLPAWWMVPPAPSPLPPVGTQTATGVVTTLPRTMAILRVLAGPFFNGVDAEAYQTRVRRGEEP